MIDFLVPLIFAIVGGNKWFCNNMCGRGQLFQKLGGSFKCSRNKTAPGWISSKWFRYGFLVFFLTMFGNMIFQTYLVFAQARSLRELAPDKNSVAGFHRARPSTSLDKVYTNIMIMHL